jgi:hypothetical protein
MFSISVYFVEETIENNGFSFHCSLLYMVPRIILLAHTKESNADVITTRVLHAEQCTFCVFQTISVW